jgi:hypothetical protein
MRDSPSLERRAWPLNAPDLCDTYALGGAGRRFCLRSLDLCTDDPSKVACGWIADIPQSSAEQLRRAEFRTIAEVGVPMAAYCESMVAPFEASGFTARAEC